MHWSMVGWSHHNTSVETRERLAFTEQQAGEAMQELSRQYPGNETVLLSTCNRVELYTASNGSVAPAGVQELAKFLAEFRGLPLAEVEDQLTTLEGPESLRHLFTVAASLDSMVVGEAQILSQVKSAYELACQNNTAAALMHQAFQRATVVARRVANETEIHRRRVSIPSVAVSEIATEFFERFDDKQILLLGAGEMGTETLRYLQDAGARTIAICNRSRDRAQTLAEQFGATVEPWEQRFELMAGADLVVSTTGASEPIATLEPFENARNHAGRSAILILDLAVPRDFDPQIGQQRDVYLFTLDDLQQVCDRNVEARRKQWPKAKQIVDQETERFLAESKHRGSGATIKQLRAQANQIKQEELERLLAKLKSRGVDEAVEKDVEIALDRLVNKILHPPMQSLRENADSGNHASLLDALRRLFQLSD